MGYVVERHFQQYFSYIVAVSFIGEGNRTAASHRDILSHHVVSSAPRLNGIRTHNVRAW